MENLFHFVHENVNITYGRYNIYNKKKMTALSFC